MRWRLALSAAVVAMVAWSIWLFVSGELSDLSFKVNRISLNEIKYSEAASRGLSYSDFEEYKKTTPVGAYCTRVFGDSANFCIDDGLLETHYGAVLKNWLLGASFYLLQIIFAGFVGGLAVLSLIAAAAIIRKRWWPWVTGAAS